MSEPLLRRKFLYAGLAGLGFTLAGCKINSSPLTGSFLQPWRSHLEWSRVQWQTLLSAMHQFGCGELFIQWLGIEDENPANRWELGRSQIEDILDICTSLNIKVHLGLPYHQMWWQKISNDDPLVLQTFLSQISYQAEHFIQTSPWTEHSAFQGWYIPYELEQYHWSSSQRIELLVKTLSPMTQAALATSGTSPTISTYFSQLQTQGSLVLLWETLLNQLTLHPMIQDGVGIAGMANYEALVPLQQMLLKRRVPFDLIVELFEQLPADQGSPFQARAADFQRVRQQWEIARNYGAQRIVAFAIDPWVLGNTPEAQQLLHAWEAAVR